MKILIVPHPILNQPAKPVIKIDKKIHQLVKGMIELLNKQVDPPGVGLAAPQVGIPLQLFLIKPTRKAKPQTFINPFIKKTVFIKDSLQKKTKKTHLEGCLSIPKIWSHVERAKKILLEYQTIDEQKKTEWFSGFEAIIIQHEIDHLKGILFTQKAIEQNAPLFEETEGKLKKIELK